MRAEDTLQFMMDFQGDLYYNRQKCLDHLFCTIGNGYKWENGELVELSEETKTLLSHWKLDKPIEYAKPLRSKIELANIEKDMLIRRLKRAGKTEKEIETILRDMKWSKPSKTYSYLFNYPKDIKEDWKKILEECKQLLIEDGYDLENIED